MNKGYKAYQAIYDLLRLLANLSIKKAIFEGLCSNQMVQLTTLIQRMKAKHGID